MLDCQHALWYYNSDLAPREEVHDRNTMNEHMSPEAAAMLMRAKCFAQFLGHEMVRPEHILAGYMMIEQPIEARDLMAAILKHYNSQAVDIIIAVTNTTPDELLENLLQQPV